MMDAAIEVDSWFVGVWSVWPTTFIMGGVRKFSTAFARSKQIESTVLSLQQHMKGRTCLIY